MSASDDDAAIECAICLARPRARDVALVAECLHAYCAKCLVRWIRVENERHERARERRDARCPTCKRTFAHVLTRRALDGSEDAEGFLRSESAALLARARWCAEGDAEEGEGGEEAEDWSEEEDLDVEVEVRTRRRVVLGNRRFGRGGYVANGGSRTFARPARETRAGKEKGGMGGGGGAVVGSPGASASSGSASPSASPAAATGSDEDASTPRQRGKKSAKRADAKAKKAEKEAQKAANRLAKRVEEAAAAEARREAAVAAKELERLALEV